MITAATPTDALAGGLVVLAVFIAGLYWQEETRALREMTQKIRTFTIALITVLSELEPSNQTESKTMPKTVSDVGTLIPLVPGGLSTAIRCGQSWWRSGWTWASILVLVLAIGVAVSGGDTFDGYLAVLLLVVVLALAIGHIAQEPLQTSATRAAETLRDRIEEALNGGRVHGLLENLLRQVAKELTEAGCDDIAIRSACALELREKLGDHMVHVAEVKGTSDDLYARLKFGEWTSPPLKISWMPDQLKTGTRVLVFLGGEPGNPNRVIGIVGHTRLDRADSKPTPVAEQDASIDIDAWDLETPLAIKRLRDRWNEIVEKISTDGYAIRCVLSELEAVM